jgi:uncharacterized membrane protein
VLVRGGPIGTVNHDSLKASEQLERQTSVTAAYTVLYTDDYILVDTTAGAVTVTLPLSKNGLVFTIMRTAGANNVTVAATAPDTVNGAASITISASFTPVTVKDFKPILSGYAQIA